MKNISFEKVLSILPKIDEKNRYFFLGGVLLVIFVVDYFLIMQPQLRTLMTLNPKVELLTRDSRQAISDIKKISDYQTQVATFKEKMKIVGSKILLKEEIPAILENISRLANDSRVRINQIMPLKESQEAVLSNDEGTYYSLPILVNARGGYHDLGRFFNQLEKSKIFMSILNFDIAANNESTVQHSAKITIKVFILDRSEEKEKEKEKEKK